MATAKGESVTRETVSIDVPERLPGKANGAYAFVPVIGRSGKVERHYTSGVVMTLHTDGEHMLSEVSAMTVDSEGFRMSNVPNLRDLPHVRLADGTECVAVTVFVPLRFRSPK